MTALTLTLEPVLTLTDDTFYELCRANPDIKFERSAQGDLIIMFPTGGESGRRNADLTTDLTLWNRQTQLGYVFDSSTCFKLPNGADRSPDAAWIEKSRWESLSPEARQKFPPIAPDFVVELRSETDHLATLQAKLREYQDNGVRLGWLLNPQDQTVEIYRPGQAVEILRSPQQLSGETILPNFVLDLTRIFS
ncbi:Uma2 family endonuclease [Trichothermofontia sp.]